MDNKKITSALSEVRRTRIGGAVCALRDNTVRISGLGAEARIGDGIRLVMKSGEDVLGEIVGLEHGTAIAMTFSPIDGASVGDRVWLEEAPQPAPCEDWLGHVVNAFGRTVDDHPLPRGGDEQPLRAAPPPSMLRKPVGTRLSTGHATFDTMLPLCEGQRVGIFAGSGIGKSRLLGALAQRMSADVVVIGLIGERGREVREFVEKTLGAEALKRAVVIAATSDEPAPVKRRAAWLTLAVAEYFRDQGQQVLLLFDSLTRFAEAHREVSLTSGEAGSLGGFPPSTTNMIAGLCERAGPGPEGSGDITAIFTVLVAGSNMEEPVADITRGILDGHIILSREIAERGRFPAIDVRRSVSRSLPDAASDAENAMISRARALLATYEQAAPMIQIGLYNAGSDPQIDEAIRVWPALDAFFAEHSEGPEAAFARLAQILAPPAAQAE
ncbi:MAG: FliI/YscN family ATPase [Neomegalonema sp.]|nr:FliI/YscN family ATPase [Neomegalonema sp.]